jgi:NAD(P)-dependent dehydrogenase (short-subunit alcohol dehydrogenase family)
MTDAVPLRLEGRRLEGKRALVTGGGRGIGSGIAHRLAAEGATVIVVDVDGAAAARTAEAAPRPRTSRHVGVAGDVTDPEALERIAATVRTEFGALDVLVNNAGIGPRGRISEYTRDTWGRVLDVNLSAPFHLTASCLPLLRDGNGAAIVNICSLAVIGLWGQAAYDASKGGLQTLTRSMAVELGPNGIRANAVCPGMIDTDMLSTADREGVDRQVRTLPIPRLGTIDDVAAAVAWLASDDAAYITGQSLFVDGGWVRW